jgi:hypothetical protein
MDKRIPYMLVPILIAAGLLFYVRKLNQVIEDQGRQLKRLSARNLDPLQPPAETKPLNVEVPKADVHSSCNYTGMISEGLVLKRAPEGASDINAWLKQFKLISQADYQQAKNGEEYFAELETRIYENGITYREVMIGEVVNYELFVPLVEGDRIKPFIDKLCKKMGGCLGEDEVNVEYNDLPGRGVIVSWEGGC